MPRPTLLLVVAAVLAGVLTAVIAPSATPAVSRDLDGDGRVERLTTVRARLPYFSVPQYGRQWSVRDVVDGRRVARRIGPPFERMHRLRFADRNADGRLEILFEVAAGNSLFFSDVWEWDGRRPRLLWRMNLGPLYRLVGRRAAINAPTFVRFPDPDGDGVRDLAMGASVGACRACPPDRLWTLTYRWSDASRRWVFARIE